VPFGNSETKDKRWKQGGKSWVEEARCTMLCGMIASSGEVRRTEAARVELCVCESGGSDGERGEDEGMAALIDSNDIFAPRATARV